MYLLNHNKRSSIILLVIAILLFVPMSYYKGIQVGESSDFDAHNRMVEFLINDHIIKVPHFLLHLLSAIAYFLTFKQSVTLSTIAIHAISYIILTYFTYVFICKQLDGKYGQKNYFYISILAICVVIASPIAFLAIFDEHLYFGYIALSTYHNPTIALLKPIAIVNFYLVTQIFSEENSNRNNITVIALTTVLAALAKPNYILCAIPALIMVYSYRIIRRRQINHIQFFAGLIIPAIIIISWQYYKSNTDAQLYSSESKIIIAPFEVYKASSSMLFEKFILSVSFPLSICIFHWKEVKQDVYLKMAWLLFAFGTIHTYFLAESGKRMFHGNFAWSGQITLFILFFVSALFFVRQNAGYFIAGNCNDKAAAISKGTTVCSVIFILHVLAGIFWYYCNFTGPRTLW